MSDFIREVDEEYRRDRAMQFLTKYQVLIAAVVVLILAAAGGWRFWTDNQIATAEKANARLDAAALLAKDGKTAEAQAAYDAIANEGPKGYAILARMRAADVIAGKDPEAAAKAFDVIASDPGVGQATADTARFRGAVLRIDREDPKAFEQRYGRFAQAGFTYRASMNELLGLAALKRSDFTAAGRYLDEVIGDPNAPTGLRNRVQAFRALVTAGAATPMAKQPPPASVAPLEGEPSVQPVPPPAAPMAPVPGAPMAAAPPSATVTPPAAPAAPGADGAKPPSPADQDR